MNFSEYQTAALRTAGPVDPQQAAGFIGLTLAGEVGELANYIKKGLYHGHEISPQVLVDELGDILWYLARAADLLGVGLDQIAGYNLAKLAARYPEGFSSQASINRPEDSEDWKAGAD